MNSAFRGGTVRLLTEGMDVGRGEELGPLWSTTGGVSSHVCFLQIGSEGRRGS